MPAANTIQIRNKGSLTLPVEMRRKYDLNEGDIFTLIDLGEGAFLLTPQRSMVDRLGSKAEEILAQQGTSLEDVLQVLDEERERYYQERYARD